MSAQRKRIIASALPAQPTLFVTITKAVIDMLAQRDNLVDSLSCQIVAMPAVPDEYALRTLISREFETFFYEKAEIAIPVLVFVALTSVKRITAGLNNLAEGVIRIADPATPLPRSPITCRHGI
ncbi:hypothetical protein HUF18_17930 [Thalassolituus sp. ST750PaO-4]|uniref:hypothetical protein n=1 Tax=Thalassolituus sp. ST750PaO-4 TaxID=2742965 RepID=UPI000C5284E1|nr:hypothetical protein [Thalassolituus sp. ST750PaO-4]MCA6061665.1 hypothetical protein [Thalassolituus sp. ST750PaO-4]PIQ41931.1 MAG: hypothetical protein COW58_00925 [Thalassolituus sp. CG17_big_fil_post_rev_8_21_14_2_50_53_8]